MTLTSCPWSMSVARRVKVPHVPSVRASYATAASRQASIGKSPWADFLYFVHVNNPRDSEGKCNICNLVCDELYRIVSWAHFLSISWVIWEWNDESVRDVTYMVTSSICRHHSDVPWSDFWDNWWIMDLPVDCQKAKSLCLKNINTLKPIDAIDCHRSWSGTLKCEIYWHYLLFLNTEMTQVVEILPCERQGTIYLPDSIP